MAPQFGPVGVGPDSRTFAHARLSISALSLLALHAQEMADVSSVYHIVHSALFLMLMRAVLVNCDLLFYLL